MTRNTLAGVVSIALTLTTAGCQGAEGAPGDDAAPVPVELGSRDVAAATRADLIAGLPVSGTLTPAVDVRIASPIAEVLEAVLVKEGQAVVRGQVLARFRTAVVRPAALSAEAQRRVAAADYERMQNLLREGAVSERDVEATLVALRAAEAAEALARQRLAEAAVRAPVSGVVAQRHVQAGDRVKDGDPLFRLVNVNELEFEASVPSQYAAEVRPGALATLSLSGSAGAVSGRVARVNATVDPATRQLQVYVIVPNRDGRLVGGLFASGRIVLREVRGAVAIPQSGLRSDAGGAYVLAVVGNELMRRDVTPGVSDDVAGLVEIVAGLSEGDVIVVGAAEGLAPGQSVGLPGRES